MRVDREPAYLLHLRPYRENSALLEVMTTGYGRVGLVFRGGRRSTGGRVRPQPFCRLSLSWSGRGELFAVTGVDSESSPFLEAPDRILCGLYANELLIHLAPRQSPNPALFHCYERLLMELSAAEAVEPVLRRFEMELLAAIGYGLELDSDALTGERLRAEWYYRYELEGGPQRCEPGAGAISGAALLALREGDLGDRILRVEIGRLLKRVLEYHLRGRTIHSRNIFRYLSRI